MDGAGTVLNAVVGIAGLMPRWPPSRAATALAQQGEPVTAGHLVTDAVRKNGLHLLPVDMSTARFSNGKDQHSAKTLEKFC